ncbi:glycosyltransferase [Nocardioides sp. WL0053]|uniref:Glycosyltransferase n=1 Tax=Nocardioides jiangsuensis TaxID=2866161 RepID=A0ABS7RK26_9ACTN|nr:glycosyltransferase [Nocardioides jiangsuensis]MBY9074423.1 glycosyltransferase [Nocardioides jiangsuensis]
MTDTAESTVVDARQDAPASTSFRVVHRTILRPEQEIDIRPLYVGGVASFGASSAAGGAAGAMAAAGGHEPERSGDPIAGLGGFGKIADDGAVVFPERRLTFGTYFNAFPASYWRRWSDFTHVRLQVTVRGEGTVSVYRSTAKGHVQRAESEYFETGSPKTLTFDLPLKPFIDGGWYWYDVEAGESEAVVIAGSWGFETDKVRQGTVSIGITTFNRPDFCVDQLVSLSQETEVLDILDEIYVVDQGTQKVSDEERFSDVAAKLGPKLRLIEQGNLGGSGGFSRAMDEATAKGDADYVLLLDDDVVCEPEGILRGVAFADLVKKTTIVGGQMFSLYDRSVMHAYGETVDKYRWFWGAAPNTKHGHNFAARSLRATEWLHRRVDVDYNGWWMCLIPTKVIKEVGLSLPMFIKWDDAEFGLRASEAGYPTVTLPGMAVWHVPWHEKDDTIDWQAYFHRRNRIVAALLHSPYERGGKLVRESFETQVRHLLSMQYSPAEMGLMAIEDILEGPQRMHRDVLKRLPELRELRKNYDDSRSEPYLDSYPAARRKKPPRKGKDSSAPIGPVGKLKTVAKGAVRQVLPPRDFALKYPEANVPHLDLKWWKLMQFDSALVSSADGTSVSWYKRNPELARDLMQRSVAVHARLAKEWPRLAEEYRQALPDLVSPDAWQLTFEQSNKKDESS